jgi:hypothetical protein
MNPNDVNNSAMVIALCSALEKVLSTIDKNLERQHQETMYSLETDRLVAQADIRLKNAQASEIEARVQK